MYRVLSLIQIVGHHMKIRLLELDRPEGCRRMFVELQSDLPEELRKMCLRPLKQKLLGARHTMRLVL